MGGKARGDGIHGRYRGGGGWSRKRRDLFKTNAVWRRWWKKEQEDRVMNTRREGIVTVNL